MASRVPHCLIETSKELFYPNLNALLRLRLETVETQAWCFPAKCLCDKGDAIALKIGLHTEYIAQVMNSIQDRIRPSL
jgi:hypothetical protein